MADTDTVINGKTHHDYTVSGRPHAARQVDVTRFHPAPRRFKHQLKRGTTDHPLPLGHNQHAPPSSATAAHQLPPSCPIVGDPMASGDTALVPGRGSAPLPIKTQPAASFSFERQPTLLAY
jgi:hypothetical protein